MDNELIKNTNKQNNVKIVLQIIIPLLIAVLSFGYLSNVASSPEFHKETIMSLESKQENVLKLSAITVTTATTASLILGDRASSISSKLLDLTGYFLVILFAIMLEKYLVTIMGLVSFKVIIPIACILFSVFTIIDRKTMRKISLKLIVFAVAAFLIIPLSINVANTIENMYEEANIIRVVEESEKIENEIKESSVNTDNSSINDNVDVEKETQATNGIIDSVKGIFADAKENITNGISGVVNSVIKSANESIDKLTKHLNKMIETIAVMLITTCAIPILMIIVFLWLIKVLFRTDFNIGLTDISNFNK